MKRSSVRYCILYFLLTLSVLVSASSLSAADNQNLPGTNEFTEQSCSEQKDVQIASSALEMELIKVAEEMLETFLQKIKDGDENKFGFNNRNEMLDATVGNTPYQMYVKCKTLDIPTNLWRIPVIVQSKTRAFITVDWTKNSWRAVDFGAAQLAEDLSTLDAKMVDKYRLQKATNLHRIIIRDYTNRRDSFSIKAYQAESLTKAKAILAFPEVIQEQTEWCWAGVTASIFDYFDKGVRQCEIAEYTRTVATWHDFGSVNCCTNPDVGCNYWNYNWYYDGSVKDILESMQSEIVIQNYGLSRKLTITEVATDLSQNKPFVIRWGWDSGGGHFLVGYGIDGVYLHYMNPWFGEGNKIGTYDWVSLGGGHTWTHTNRISSVWIAPPPTQDFSPIRLLLKKNK